MRIFRYSFAFIILITSVFAANATHLQERTEVLAQRMRKNLDLRVDTSKKEIPSKAQKIEHITSGKGTWVNIWNYPKDTKVFIDRLKKFKIDTIYLQVNRSNTKLFYNKAGVDRILKEAHDNDIKVIGWSYCYLKNVADDAEKFIKVAQYKSPDGESFDAMAADMEENTSRWAVQTYSNKIKQALPKDYPLIAIIYSPKIKQDYPWELVAKEWDILMPMVYWHGLKNRNHQTVYNFVTESIADLKRLAKKDDLNIHLITDGDRTSHYEVATSIKAALDDGGVNAGISIYPEHLASDAMLRKLSKFN